MKTIDQRIAIAKSIGWHSMRQCPSDPWDLRRQCYTNDSNGHPPDEVTEGVWLGKHPGSSEAALYSVLPDYLTNLNVMAHAEKTLTPDQWQRYALWLGPLTTERISLYIGATAAQRAEAFLRTLNLWTEDGS